MGKGGVNKPGVSFVFKVRVAGELAICALV